MLIDFRRFLYDSVEKVLYKANTITQSEYTHQIGGNPELLWESTNADR